MRHRREGVGRGGEGGSRNGGRDLCHLIAIEGQYRAVASVDWT